MAACTLILLVTQASTLPARPAASTIPSEPARDNRGGRNKQRHGRGMQASSANSLPVGQPHSNQPARNAPPARSSELESTRSAGDDRDKDRDGGRDRERESVRDREHERERDRDRDRDRAPMNGYRRR